KSRTCQQNASHVGHDVVLSVEVKRIRSARGRGGGGHCPYVRNDRVDLVVLQVVLEGGHARRSVDDVFAHDGVIAVGRGLVQRRTIGSRIEGRWQVADAAGLRQQLPAVALDVVEVIGCLLGGGAAGPKGNKAGGEW